MKTHSRTRSEFRQRTQRPVAAIVTVIALSILATLVPLFAVDGAAAQAQENLRQRERRAEQTRGDDKVEPLGGQAELGAGGPNLVGPDGPDGPSILGGEPVSGDDYPHLVAIVLTTGNGLPICSGNLVAAQYVLTAAHCVADEWSGVPADVSTFDVVIGQDVVNGAQSSVAVESITVHPKFRTVKVDLAVLRLAQPYEGVSDYPVLTGQLTTFDQFTTDESAFVTPFYGYGRDVPDIFPGSPSGRLQRGFGQKMPWWTASAGAPAGWQDFCVSIFQSLGGSYECLNTGPAGIPCPADSGGPVTEPLPDRFYQIGVIRSTQSQSCLDPTVLRYTPVYPEKCWIDEHTNQTATWRLSSGTVQQGLPDGICDNGDPACTDDFVEWGVASNAEADAQAQADFDAAVSAGENPDPLDAAFQPELVDLTPCLDDACADESALVTLVETDSPLSEDCSQLLTQNWLEDHMNPEAEMVCVEEYAASVIDPILDGVWNGQTQSNWLSECLIGAQYCPNPYDYMPTWAGGMSGLPCNGLEGWSSACGSYLIGQIPCWLEIVFGDSAPGAFGNSEAGASLPGQTEVPVWGQYNQYIGAYEWNNAGSCWSWSAGFQPSGIAYAPPTGTIPYGGAFGGLC